MSRRRPDILLCFVDDQRFNTIHALNNPQIHTPNLDRLVHRGTCFTEAHHGGSTHAAVCMPSRAMLHTGKTLFRLENSGATIPREHTLLGEHLQRHGYKTYGVGKWHNGTESFARSFTGGDEIFFGGMADHWNVPLCHFDPAGRYDTTIRKVSNPFISKHEEIYPCDHIHPGRHSTDIFGDAAVSIVRNHVGPEPMFLYLAFMAPHDPRVMPDEYRQRYNDQELPLPDNFMPRHPFDAGVHDIRDEKLAGSPRTKEETREHLGDYYAMITHLDAQLGRVLDALEETGRLDNTIVIFSADHGIALGSHGLFGKQNLYDPSVRVPMIFAGPDIPASQQRHGFAMTCDIFPTICGLIGVDIPESVEGLDLTPAIRDENQPERPDVYLVYQSLMRGVRDHRYKLIEYHVHGKRHTQLFDMADDPNELKNLADAPGYGKTLTDLRRRLIELANAQGDIQSPWGKEFWSGMDFN